MGNLWADAYRTLREEQRKEQPMPDLSIIVRATQASARAVSSMSRWQFVMNDLAREGKRGTPQYHQASFNLSRAQQRYRTAQRLLALNPLHGE
jgi:hypothetical protein